MNRSGLTTTNKGDKFSGAWSIEFIIGAERVPAILNLKLDGARLYGTIEGPFPPTAIGNGTAGTSGFQFTAVVNLSGQRVEMTFTGNVTNPANGDPAAIGSGDSIMNGTAVSTLGTVQFKGTRNSVDFK